MKTLKLVLLVSCVGILLGSTALANADAGPGKKASRITVYDSKEPCRTICRTPKPVLEALEDFFAFVLDIPLAMLSPITCPIISSLPEESD